MKVQELRNLSKEELNKTLNDAEKKLYDMNYQRKYGRVEKPHMFKVMKKEIAQVKTILKERANER
jgi:large subunit ribosomal protein L29